MSLAPLHPQIVHFVIALLFAGVVFRCIALTSRAAFTGPAAAVLLLVGTLGAVLAAKSGTDAHGPVERVPGSRAAVVEHDTGSQVEAPACASCVTFPRPRQQRLQPTRGIDSDERFEDERPESIA